MKRLLASVSLVALTTTAALAAPVNKPTPKPASSQHVKAPPLHIAPADEYFGKLKISVLGIRNTIKDVGANLDIDPARWTTMASKAAFAEDAMRDWEAKYPQDTWLAKTVFSLERMYAKLDSSDGRTHAMAAMKWLVHDFPASWYGKTGKKELAAGKVGHPPSTAESPATAAPGTASASVSVPAAAIPAAVNAPAPQSSNEPAAINPSSGANPDQNSTGAAAASPLPSASPTGPSTP